MVSLLLLLQQIILASRSYSEGMWNDEFGEAECMHIEMDD